jgi:glycosyltransferase involved in cell wall biosynthesis
MAKVAMLLSNPYVSDERVYREATSLLRRGHTVTVYAWDRQGQHAPFAEENGIKVERLHIPAGYGRGVRSLTAFARFGLAAMGRVLTSSFDIVHCHDLDTLPFGYMVARLRGKPVIFDAHEPYSLYTHLPELLRRSIALLEGWLAHRADYLIVVTPQMVHWAAALGANKVALVANYADDSFALPDGPVLRPPDQPLVLGWIGNIKPVNQLELVIEAVYHFNARHSDKPLRLLLVGPVLPDYEQTLRQQAQRLGDWVTFVGPVPHQEVPNYYRQIDLAIIVDADTPHNRVALALKLFEAMAMGVPVIVPPRTGEQEIVSLEQCGLVLADYEVETIVAGLESLSADSKNRLALGRNGWHAVRRRYNWAISEQILFEVYDKLLGTPEKVSREFSSAIEG